MIITGLAASQGAQPMPSRSQSALARSRADFRDPEARRRAPHSAPLPTRASYPHASAEPQLGMGPVPQFCPSYLGELFGFGYTISGCSSDVHPCKLWAVKKKKKTDRIKGK